MILILFLLSYFIGSFPSAYFLSKVISHKNILTLGDKNVGARNVYHSVGKKIGLLTFLFDFTKGAFIWWIGFHFKLTDSLLFFALFFAWIGHCYPIWLHGKGGKGVAVIIGFTTPQYILSSILSVFFFFGLKKWIKNFDLLYTITVLFFLLTLVLSAVSFLRLTMVSVMFLLPLSKNLLTKQKRE
ncbi:glycerol-3-phosphate acyltransferase [bacterium]|nr:glycerol-3-phosphate acyltransferase [bacterium]